jgi:hypothetical protein
LKLILHSLKCKEERIPSASQILRTPHLLEQMVLEKPHVPHVGRNLTLKSPPCGFYVVSVVAFFVHEPALVVHCDMIVITIW